MAEHPAGTVTVKGIDFPVTVDDDGTWTASVANVPVTADTKAQLKERIRPRLRHVQTRVSIPFLLALRTEDQQMTGAVRCTATGIHSGTGRVLATRDDTGEQVQLEATGSHRYLSGAADPGEWARLVREYLAASRAIYAYEQAHQIDVRKAGTAGL